MAFEITTQTRKMTTKRSLSEMYFRGWLASSKMSSSLLRVLFTAAVTRESSFMPTTELRYVLFEYADTFQTGSISFYYNWHKKNLKWFNFWVTLYKLDEIVRKCLLKRPQYNPARQYNTWRKNVECRFIYFLSLTLDYK